jgi:3-oxoacyl-[acyl-carrier protein] reductase
MSIKEKVVLITGATRGIGREIALQLGLQGATILGTATTEEGAQKISAMLSEKNIKGKGYVMDIANRDSINHAITAMHADFAPATILVNNAGINRDNIFLRMKDEQWHQVIQTNLDGAYYLTKACLKPMVKARWGRIINVSSVVAITGNFGQANYVAAKAGLIGFTKVLAIELAGYGITANCVAPGFIQTDMTGNVSEKHQELILAKIPMQRVGRPEDIAYAVAFLASDQAAYITGETLHVNGGMCMV